VVYLNWIPSDGASTYGIYRGTASGAETLYQSGISSISYNDTGVSNGTTYYYKVVAVSGSVTSPASNESSATPEPVPNPPTGLSAAAGVLQIVLSWTSPTPTPNTYNIYRGTASGQEGGVPVATGVAAATYIDTDPTLDPSQTYYYEVTSLLNGVEGVPSNEAFAAPTAPAPAAPVIDEAISEGGQVTLGWQPSTYAASYSVFRGITASGEGSTPIASGITGNSYTDTGLTGGTAYYYTVAAVGSGGSAVSQQCMAIPYTAPTNLSAAAGDQEVLLTWAPITGASSNGGGYIVSRSVTAGGPYEQIPGPPITGGTAYLDTDVDNGLTTGTTYYYVVQYVDSHGYASSESSELAVTTIQAAGTWTVNLTPAGASSGLTTGTNCSSVGTNSNTEITVEALANGPQSAAVTQTGTASCSGTWSIMWTPNTPTSYPGLLVLTEDQYQALSDQVAGSLTGSASVSVAGGYSLTVDDPSTVTALIDSPVTSHTIDTSTTGIVNFLTASTDHSVTVQSNQIAGVTAGYSESQSTCTHIIHVYTPAYFAQNYTDPTNITLTFNTTPQSATATAQLPAGAPASASIAVSGDIGDEFSCYTPGAN
jgi:fibronectin type 3 domain-containing protein